MSKIFTAIFDSDKFFQLFSDALRNRRQAGGFTQLELIEVLRKQNIKVSQAYLSQLQAGQRREPSARIVIVLSAVLGIELEKIILACKSTPNE